MPKNRPNKLKTAPAGTYVKAEDVFATFVHQAASLGNEVAARRCFDEDVAAFLKERELIEDFNAFREQRGNRPEREMTPGWHPGSSNVKND